MKSEQDWPAAFSISFEMLSSPVALPVESEWMLAFISVVEMGVSQSRVVWVDIEGFL